jgi:methyl-accepting chemotaxis protein
MPIRNTFSPAGVRTDMLEILGSIVPDWQSAGLVGAAALAIAFAAAAWRMQAGSRRVTYALDYMSQGLCVFDKSARIVICNRRYIDMYKLSPDLVKPGSTLRQLIAHRKDTGLFAGDVDQYYKEIVDNIASGKPSHWFLGGNDGRIMHAINTPTPDGGWVVTHEDVTEQRQLQKQRDETAEQDRRRGAIDALIAAFRSRMEPLLKTFGDSAAAMKSTATTLSAASQHTAQRAERAVDASSDASMGVQTAALATDQLSNSIAEIARQIEQTHNVVRAAVDEAQSTSGEITTLSDTAQKIGDIVKLIQDIAGQTNLLALNATIEAARAGDAGRGFAVVASEVKSLAVQTAKATEAIAGQILAVQGSTASAVGSIRCITQRMQEIQYYTSAVAASIEQQNAATGNISQNVAASAQASDTVAKVLTDVAGAAKQTRMSAQTVLDTSQSVEAAIDDLRKQVEEFLAGVAA